MVGTVTISMELELAWGTHDKARYSHLSENGEPERNALRFFLDLCDELDIPVSFDIVGHLLHDSCPGHHPGSHPGGWWSEDPGTDEDTDPLFYGTRLVDDVLGSDTDHELCTHTYSHILCKEMDESVLNLELSMVSEQFDERGLPRSRSIVTPRHQSPPYEVLRDHGIRTIRKPLPDYQRSKDERLQRAKNFISFLFADHPPGRLELTDGMVETFCTPAPSLTSLTLSNCIAPPHDAFRTVPLRIRQQIHRNYLVSAFDRAATTEGHVHLWTHLCNMSNENQWKPIRQGLKHLRDLIDDALVEVRPMRELHLEFTSKTRR